MYKTVSPITCATRKIVETFSIAFLGQYLGKCDLVLVVKFAVCGSSFSFKTLFLRLVIIGSVF